MKRLLPIFFLTCCCLLTSCTQEYICQCVVKYSGKQPGLTDSSVHEFPIKNTKKEASSLCEQNSVLVTENGITMDEKCRLY